MKRGEFTYPTTCACGETKGEIICAHERHQFPMQSKLCKCGIIRADPYYAPEDMEWFYQKEYRTEHRDFEKQWAIETNRGETVRQIVNHMVEYETALEWGAGLGGIAYEMGCPAWEMNDECREWGAAQGVQMLEAPEPADLIILSHVMEHFVDPVEELKALREYADPYMLVILPGLVQIAKSYDNTYARYAEDAHPWAYCLETAKYVLSLAGFETKHGEENVQIIAEKVEIPEYVEPPKLGANVKRVLKTMDDLRRLTNLEPFSAF